MIVSDIPAPKVGILFIFQIKFKVFAGGYGEEVPPDSIPNSEVKLFSADGTAWETVWESRTSPALNFLAPVGFSSSRGFFYAWKRRIYIESVVAGLNLV